MHMQVFFYTNNFEFFSLCLLVNIRFYVLFGLYILTKSLFVNALFILFFWALIVFQIDRLH